MIFEGEVAGIAGFIDNEIADRLRGGVSHDHEVDGAGGNWEHMGGIARDIAEELPNEEAGGVVFFERLVIKQKGAEAVLVKLVKVRDGELVTMLVEPRKNRRDIHPVGARIGKLGQMIPADVVFRQPDRIAGSLRGERRCHLFEHGFRMGEGLQHQIIRLFEAEALLPVILVMHDGIKIRLGHERSIPDFFVVGGVAVWRKTDADLSRRTERLERRGEWSGGG